MFKTLAYVDNTRTFFASATDKPDNEVGVFPELKFYGAAVVLVAVGAAVGTLVFDHLSDGVTFTPPEGIGIFALFYVVAQVIERIQEPLAPFVQADGKDEAQAKKDRDDAAAQAFMAPSEDTARTAANTQAVVDQRRANTRVLLFGTGAFLGMLGCGYLHALFLQTVGVAGIRPWVDLLITGLVVGGGTKLLHDLISNLQASKDEKKDASASGKPTT